MKDFDSAVCVARRPRASALVEAFNLLLVGDDPGNPPPFGLLGVDVYYRLDGPGSDELHVYFDGGWYLLDYEFELNHDYQL